MGKTEKSGTTHMKTDKAWWKKKQHEERTETRATNRNKTNTRALKNKNREYTEKKWNELVYEKKKPG